MENENGLVSFLRQNIVFLAVLVAILLLAISGGIILYIIIHDGPPPPPPPPTVTPTNEIDVTVWDIRPIAELATIEYQAVAEIQDERVPDDFRQYLGIKEQVLLLAYGEVKAGFDLSKLSEEDLWTDGTRAQLHLPPPEILWEGEIYDTAQDSIRQGAIEAGILEDAARYGQLYYENFLRSLGFTEVQVIVD